MSQLLSRAAFVSVVLPGLVACNAAQSGIADVLPEVDRVVINHPGETATESYAAKSVASDEAAPQEGPKGCQDATAHLTRQANDEVRRTLEQLERITSQAASSVEGDTYIYLPPEAGERPEGEMGPPPQGGQAGAPPEGEMGPPPQGDQAEAPPEGEMGPPPQGSQPPPMDVPHRLVVTEYEDGSYTFAFQLDPDESGAWIDHVTGRVDAGSTPEAGSGAFVIDYGAMGELDPEHLRTGSATYQYSFTADGAREIDAALDQLTNREGELFDATLFFEQSATAEANLQSWRLDESGEQINDLARWDSTTAGRCDSMKTGGDLGDALGELSQCWDSSRAQVYSLKSLDGAVQEERGDVAQCVFSDNAFDL